MIGDYEDDAHFCLKCHATILGLNNYVNHRKSSCSKPNDPSKSPLPSQLLPPDEIGLKADDFFSSLELRSSSKKPSPQSTSGKNFSGILTRSKTTAVIQATSNREQIEPQQSKSGKNIWIGGHQLKELGHGDNQSKLIKAVDNLERRKEEVTKLNNVFEESEDESDDYDYDVNDSSDEDAPPRNHTGGKWKPTSPIQWGRDTRDWNAPPPNYTGGKWKPLKRYSPPPTHTRGKWKPSYIKETEDDSIPPPSFTGSKWVSSKRHEYHDAPPSSHTKGKWKPRNDNDYEFPPPTHTKGKWKPGDDDTPPPTHTKGKWKPRSEYDNSESSINTKEKWNPRISSSNEFEMTDNNKEKDFEIPSVTQLFTEEKSTTIKAENVALSSKQVESEKKPVKVDTTVQEQPININVQSNFTRGKWLPTSQNKILKISDDSPFRKSSGTVQYWCSPCNRRLASKIIYDRHLKSELHFKRTSHEGEFDDGAGIRRIKTKCSTFNTNPAPKIVKKEKKRKRKKIYEICNVCQSKVNKYLIGKHLISHYHCRKSDISTDTAKNMILDNIYSVVQQSPFQCGMCKFYCNTHQYFLDHWKSQYHKDKTFLFLGYYWCSFCKFRGPDSNEMLKHLTSPEHLEVVSVINRSVPIVIKKIMPLTCLTCSREFTLHIQLLNHCRKNRHDDTNVKLSNAEVYNCNQCTHTFSSFITLQRHKRDAHDDRYFLCIPCNIKFSEAGEAKQHRKTQEHRYACMKRKVPEERLKRKCEHCQQSFANFLLLKDHLKSEHPEHKKRCPHCGATFTITQELTNHLRSKSCKFDENTEHSYRCEKCPYTSDSPGELLYHIALHDEPLLISPLGEGEETNSSSKVKPVPRYKCPICETMYPKISLQAHIRQHTQERPFECKICKATFARRNNMLFHVKNHERKNEKPKQQPSKKEELKGEKPFLCSTCGDAFKKKYTLQQHMMVHSEKDCKCPKKGCFYTARKMSEIVEHFRIHCNARDFACDQCDYKAKTNCLLKRHLSIHEATKKYQCSHCQFTARTSAHLKRHARLHTGAKPFSCPHCKYKSNTLENLRKHVISTSKHPGKCIYECKFCTDQDSFHSNFAKEFKVHILTKHPAVFGNRKEATTYVAGIYEAREDIGDDIEGEEEDDVHSRGTVLQTLKIDNQGTSILKTNKDPVVTQLLSSESGPSKTKHLDQLLPMFVIPKDESGNVYSWNLVGRYDVEESGTLVPFQSDGDSLFQEHF